MPRKLAMAAAALAAGALGAAPAVAFTASQESSPAYWGRTATMPTS